MRAHPSVSEKEWGRRSTKGECYAGSRLRQYFVPGSTGRLAVDGKIFRHFQQPSESHLPVNSASINEQGPKSGPQAQARGSLLGSRGRSVKVALSMYMIAFEGDIQQ